MAPTIPFRRRETRPGLHVASPPRRGGNVALMLGGLGAFVLVGCTRAKAHERSAPENSSGTLVMTAQRGGDSGPEEPSDEVKPVYPVDDAPPHPAAVRLCRALHDEQEMRRAACCSEKPGLVFTSECVRTLSAALRYQAVTLVPAELDRCVSAIEATYAGCNWTGPYPPPPPEACRGIVHGALPRGARCRSTLECAGGMYCHGVGPTEIGRCGESHADGESCGGSVDSLVTYTRDDTARSHPECSHVCNHRKCQALVATGAACSSSTACGPRGQCKGGNCIDVPPGKEGEPCPGKACERDLVCVEGTCRSRRGTGATCSQDVECIGGCLQEDAGTHGVCGPKCGSR